MIKKKNLYIIIFSVFVFLNYFDFIGGHMGDFYDALLFNTSSGDPLFLNKFQEWIFNLLVIVSNSFIVGMIVGLLAYFFKTLNKLKAVMIGIVLQYLLPVSVMVWAIASSSGITMNDFDGLGVKFVILLLLQILSVVIFSILGYGYGHDLDYLDNKDKDLSFIYGISKKIWIVLVFAFNPVLQFLSKLTIVMIYEISKLLSSKEYWVSVFKNFFSEDSPLLTLIMSLFGILLPWFISITIFSYGLNTIRDKKSEYRILKIILIFVIIPSVFLFVPLIRNRTWFF